MSCFFPRLAPPPLGQMFSIRASRSIHIQSDRKIEIDSYKICEIYIHCTFIEMIDNFISVAENNSFLSSLICELLCVCLSRSHRRFNENTCSNSPSILTYFFSLFHSESVINLGYHSAIKF